MYSDAGPERICLLKRRMKVYELGGKAQIKITGNWVSEVAGFCVGDAIDVELCDDGSLRISHPVVEDFPQKVSNSSFTSKKAR